MTLSIGNIITCRIVIDAQLIKLVQYHICLKFLKLASQYKLFHNDNPTVQGTYMAKNISWIGARRWHIIYNVDNVMYTRTQFKLHAYLVETFHSTKSFISTEICAFEYLTYTIDLSIYSYPAVQLNISPSILTICYHSNTVTIILKLVLLSRQRDGAVKCQINLSYVGQHETLLIYTIYPRHVPCITNHTHILLEQLFIHALDSTVIGVNHRKD